MTDAAPWGDSRANRFIPIEQDSPPGPYFQPDPLGRGDVRRQRRADCQADCNEVGECDAPEKALTVGFVALLGAAAAYAAACVESEAEASGWCHGVRMRGPSAVIAIVNSKWAASEPSWE